MPEAKWRESEKKIARRVFDAALERELIEVMAEFKARAASAKEPKDMWAVQEYLEHMQREIDSKYDYRYSQLDLVFARLLREGRVSEQDLSGLSEARFAYIRCVASL